MRILQIYNKVPFPPKDGGSVAVTNISEGFLSNNVEAELLCLNTKKHFVNINTTNTFGIKTESVYINTDISYYKALLNLFFSKKPYNAQRFFSKKFKEKLKEKLKEKKFDIIQIEGLYMMPYAKTVKKYSNAKISFRAHNIEHKIWLQTTKYQPINIKNFYYKILSRRIKKFEISYINKYDYLIPISQSDAETFKKLGNKKPLHICPAGINLNKYKPANMKTNNEFSIFSLGSLDWEPNIEGLKWFTENVWNKLKITYPKIKFTIAGRNPSGFISEYFIKNKIDFKGEIQDAKLFLSEQKIMVVPLFSGSGMRIKIIEAMACGIIVISTSKGAEGINAENGKEIFIADSSEDFIKIIINIYENKIDLKPISEAAKKFISENFDNFAITKKLTDFFINNQ